MFGSRTIVEHLARGTIGLASLAAAVAWTPTQPAVWLVAIPVAALAFRGCPMCWTVGLAETVVARLGGRSTEGAAAALKGGLTTDGAGPLPSGSNRTLDSSHEEHREIRVNS